MRQAVLVEPKHIEFREVEAPKASDLKEHQVLLNIKRIGICGSEIHSYHGCHPATFYPVVQGHEYSAVVVATGMAVTICKAGDVVPARPQLACGKCKPFRQMELRKTFLWLMMTGLRCCLKVCHLIMGL